MATYLIEGMHFGIKLKIQKLKQIVENKVLTAEWHHALGNIY